MWHTLESSVIDSCEIWSLKPNSECKRSALFDERREASVTNGNKQRTLNRLTQVWAYHMPYWNTPNVCVYSKCGFALWLITRFNSVAQIKSPIHRHSFQSSYELWGFYSFFLVKWCLLLRKALLSLISNRLRMKSPPPLQRPWTHVDLISLSSLSDITTYFLSVAFPESHLLNWRCTLWS